MIGPVDRVAALLWDEFCPGIRQTPGDAAHYRALASKVIEAAREGGPTPTLEDLKRIRAVMEPHYTTEDERRRVFGWLTGLMLPMLFNKSKDTPT